MNEMRKVGALRPEYLQSVPVLVDNVFDEPDKIVSRVKDNAPYRTVSAYHGDFGESTDTAGWFRKKFDDDVFLENPRWTEAAKKAFSSKIVRPFSCLLNLNIPGPAGTCHVDIPQFRGLTVDQAPLWLLISMGHSGLFQPWMVPVAAGLVWFYRGENGAFEYWLSGTDEPPSVVPSPMWNIGLVSDNLVMFHRIGAVGSDKDQERYSGVFQNSDTIHYTDQDRWDVYNGDLLKASLTPDQVRISFLWLAHVFRDEAHLASFEDPAFNLTIDQVVDMFDADLKTRGVVAPRPTNIVGSDDWRRVIEHNYTPSFDPGKHVTKRR